MPLMISQLYRTPKVTHAADWLATLDKYAYARTDGDCEKYMAAYMKIYGVDQVPRLASRSEWRYFDSVEIMQWQNGH